MMIDLYLYVSTYLFMGLLILIALDIQQKTDDHSTLVGLWILWPIVITTLILKKLAIILWRAIHFLIGEFK